MTPYYAEDGIVLYHGDCREILPELGPVDLVITSPPYNINMTTGERFPARHGPQSRSAKWSGALLADGYGSFSDKMPFPEYEEWQRNLLLSCWNLLSEEGAIYYNHKPRPQADGLWLPLKVNPGLPMRQIVIWARAGGINFSPTHYCPTYEWVIVFAKPAFRLRNKAASGAGDLWYIPQEANTPHPAPFPLQLPKIILETTAAQLILDPFAGSGTTGVAAKQLGRKALLIEIEESYCEIAATRLSNTTPSLFAPLAPQSEQLSLLEVA